MQKQKLAKTDQLELSHTVLYLYNVHSHTHIPTDALWLLSIFAPLHIYLGKILYEKFKVCTNTEM